MIKRITLFLVALLTTQYLSAQTSPMIFGDQPSISPDGQTIVFSYDTDLWQIPVDGGTASRLTALDGKEAQATYSPDGKWIAFSSNQFGNNDVFMIPSGGGAIQQLTFHQSSDMVSSWSWDSQTIYFTSNRYNRISTYAISTQGGTPKRLFEHYFNNVHNLVVHPNGNEVFFNESWESDNFTHRKGYKGAYNPDIKRYNLTSGTYKKLTDYEGKDLWPMLDKKGTLYFVSDQYNGEYNLYSLVDGKPKRLTRFDQSIKNPAISANGQKVVFQKDYRIWTYDTKSKKSKEVPISVVKNNVLNKTKDFKVAGNISDFDIASDGKKIAFVARGELFVSDIEGKFVRQIPTKADGRVLEAHWLKDNKTILFNQTVGGYQNWFTVAADGSQAEQQHTRDQANNRNLSFNSDKTKAVYLSGREEVRLLDLESKSSSLLTKLELWGFYNDLPRFTSDDMHVILSAYENFEQEIYLINIENKSVQNLSNTAVTENSPFISPDSQYLYFTSNRTQPSYPFGLQNGNIYRVALQNLDRPYKSDKFDQLFEEKEKDEKKTDSDSTETEEKPKKQLEIDTEGLMDRIESVGATFGSQSGPYVLQKGEKTTIVYSSNHDEGKFALWTTVLEPFEKPVTKKVEGTTFASLNIKSAKNNYYTLVRGKIVKVDFGSNKAKPIDIQHTFRRNLEAEFNQMFYETWANLEENFYDGDFHGVDWPGMRDAYAQKLPFVGNRDNLRLLINDMLGELNTSHFGFSSFGPEENIYYGTRTMATGIEFDKEDSYVVKRIIRNTPASRKGKDIQVGDRLIAVNGNSVDPTQNRERYFIQPSLDEEISLKFQRGGEKIEVKLHPTSYTNVRAAQYDEWEKDCKQMVDEQSNNRIAYAHMKNMSGGELQKFLQRMVSQIHQKDALILDLRWNTGGNVHDSVLRFLSQKPYLRWKYRGGKLTPQSNFGPADKPIILLINEQSLSDAEMTAAGFKELGLGKIVGTETYRWIIFTSGKGLVDGSFYRLPSWGCYTLDGKNIEKTGVAPDIFVQETFKDRLEGNDLQLKRAIEEIMKDLN